MVIDRGLQNRDTVLYLFMLGTKFSEENRGIYVDE